MQLSHNRTTGRARAVAGRLTALAVIAYAMHFAWEMAQARFFATMQSLPFWRATAWCARAAGWDVLIEFVAYSAAVLIVRDVRWPRSPRLLPSLIFIGAGLTIT